MPRDLFHRTAALAWSLVWIAAAGGCDQGSGFVRGEELVVQDCRAARTSRTFAPFELELTFMAADRKDDVMLMVFAPEVRAAPPTDRLAVTVSDLAGLRQDIKMQGFAERVLGSDDSVVRVELGLYDQCPQALYGVIASSGLARFDALSPHGGEPVRAHFDFELANQRTGEPIGYGFVAEVDFDVELGSPYQEYIDPVSQNH